MKASKTRRRQVHALALVLCAAARFPGRVNTAMANDYLHHAHFGELVRYIRSVMPRKGRHPGRVGHAMGRT